jgi:hypothetical protein
MAWEYRQEKLADPELMDRVNELGAEGWEWFLRGDPHTENRMVVPKTGAKPTEQTVMVAPCFFKRMRSAEPAEQQTKGEKKKE